MSGCWLHLQTAGDFGSQLVMMPGETAGILGETAGIHGRQLVRPQAVLGDLFSPLEETAGILGETVGILGENVGILGENVGILGRHLVKPQAVFGDLELLLQRRVPSYPDLAVNELHEELVDQPRLLELHGTCWPPSLAFSGLTPADCCQLCPPEPTLEWEDHHQMESQPILRGESGKGGEGEEEEGRRKGKRCN